MKLHTGRTKTRSIQPPPQGFIPQAAMIPESSNPRQFESVVRQNDLSSTVPDGYHYRRDAVFSARSEAPESAAFAGHAVSAGEEP